MKKVKFFTLGCKVNQYETQAMREALLQKGIREEGEGATDLVILNTCTVTAEADRENRYWIRRLRRENPRARILVTGCWVERNRVEVERLSGVDGVFSNQEKWNFADRLFSGCGTPGIQDNRVAGRGAAPPLPSRLRPRTEYAPLHISSFQGRARAFVKIQDGCNHACSFCKVVLVRGRSRSRPLDEILAEAGRLRESGFREIVLTGIQLGAYGADLEPRLNLVSVLGGLAPTGGQRIRLSSIEPTDVKDDLIQAMKELPSVCPQLHIPLQSGDSEVLRKMNRRYDRDFYGGLIQRLRQEIPDFCLSMDVMAGFPGEEETHFQNTLSLIEAVRPIRIHAFPYSRREGTRAARWENLPRAVVRGRMRRLLDFSTEITRREKERFLGRCLPVLVEEAVGAGHKPAPPYEVRVQGHTPNYLKVRFPGRPEWLGKSVLVKLEALNSEGTLEGRAVGEAA